MFPRNFQTFPSWFHGFSPRLDSSLESYASKANNALGPSLAWHSGHPTPEATGEAGFLGERKWRVGKP